MRMVLKLVQWSLIAALGLSGLALMVAPVFAQREMFAARSVDNSGLASLPGAQTTTAASTGSQSSTNRTGPGATAGSSATLGVTRTGQAARSGLPQSRPHDPGVGSVRDLLGLALLILGLAVALYSQPRPRIEHTPHQ